MTDNELSATRICHYCGGVTGAKTYCLPCQEGWGARPAPDAMTADEREAEMKTHEGAMEVEWTLLHQRVERLVGRPVWTHEFGMNWVGLVKESRWETRPATIEEIIELIPTEKRIIVGYPHADSISTPRKDSDND